MIPLNAHVRRVALTVLVMAAAMALADQKKAKPETTAGSGSRQGKAAAVTLPDADIPSALAGKHPEAGARPAKESGKAAPAFEELNFNRTLVIEGKVEKPAVQFTLLKEPPPEKEIRFETSFLQNILKLDRENTFSAGETYGHE